MQEGSFRDTPTTRCAFYRRIGGLAAGVDPHTGRITVPAGSVWGLGMAAYLGHEVREELRRRGSATGPIVSYPRSGCWVFLVRPDLPDSTASSMTAKSAVSAWTVISSRGICTLWQRCARSCREPYGRRFMCEGTNAGSRERRALRRAGVRRETDARVVGVDGDVQRSVQGSCPLCQ